MAKITVIKPQKRKERYNIYLEGKFAFGLDEITLVRLGLKVGQEIDEVELARFKNEGERAKLFDKTLRFLAFRPRSEREVRDYLSRRLLREKDQEETVEEILERLKELKFVDDYEFASWWFQQRRLQKKGSKLIRLELFQKGVKKEIIEDILAAAEKDPGTDYELARQAAEKKMPAYEGLEKREFRQKMGNYLARRGFAWETIRRVIQEIS